MFLPRNRDEIHANMLRNAAVQWGLGDNIPDEFTIDPAIRLLLGAVATESERIGNEIEASRARVMERLAEVLTPETLTVPLPAHAVASVYPVEPYTEITQRDTFSVEHKDTDFAFTPINDYTLTGAKVQMIATEKKLYQWNEGAKELLLECADSRMMPSGNVWIGLACVEGVEDLAGLRLFFDWKNQPDKPKLIPLLALTQWELVGEQNAELEIGVGWSGLKSNSKPPAQRVLEDFLSPQMNIRENISQFYAPQIITLQKKKGVDEAIRPKTLLFPGIFNDFFEEDDLRRLRDPLVWLKITFSRAFTADTLHRTEIYANPFPVMNRSITLLNRQIPLHLPIIPLQISDNEAFLGIESVSTIEGENIPQGPFQSSENNSGLRVAVRTAGTAMLDARSAPILLEHTLDVIRDEYQAFAAFDRDQLGSALSGLRQQIRSLEETVRPLRKAGQGVPCLYFRGLGKTEEVQIQYWVTTGSLGNNIPAGKSLIPDTKTKYSLLPKPRMVTSTIGGRNQPIPSERLHLYRQAVLTRGRIISTEDIKAFSMGYLQENIWQEVLVKTTHKISKGVKDGLVRCIEVVIVPAKTASLLPEEWRSLVYQLESALNERSAGLLPIFVDVEGMKP